MLIWIFFLTRLITFRGFPIFTKKYKELFEGKIKQQLNIMDVMEERASLLTHTSKLSQCEQHFQLD